MSWLEKSYPSNQRFKRHNRRRHRVTGDDTATSDGRETIQLKTASIRLITNEAGFIKIQRIAIVIYFISVDAVKTDQTRDPFDAIINLNGTDFFSFGSIKKTCMGYSLVDQGEDTKDARQWRASCLPLNQAPSTLPPCSQSPHSPSPAWPSHAHA